MKSNLVLWRWIAIAAILIAASMPRRSHAQVDIEAEARTLRPALQKAEQLVTEGKIEEANQVILAVFPEATRTPVQALALANVLFKQDPKTSYALHKRAAEEMKDESSVYLEWALEQHRAKEYEGAAASYAAFAKTNPQFAPVYGLWAECLIRTDKVPEAAAMWRKSESAGIGTLDDFEELVCEVNSGLFPHRKRAELLAKMKAGDIEAAEELIELDCHFERDWWNSGPQRALLEHDRGVIQSTKFADTKRAAEVMTAADCALAAADVDLKSLLRERGLIFDAASTLPRSGRMLSIILAYVLDRKAMTTAQARTSFGDAALASARASKDAEMFNLAAHLYLGTPRLSEIDQLGWDSTDDERFAISLLVGLMSRDELKIDDARLAKAQQQFPENSELAAILVGLNAKAGKPMQEVLVHAIKSEYTRFSIQHGIVPRRSARPLRAYFGMLSAELPK